MTGTVVQFCVSVVNACRVVMNKRTLSVTFLGLAFNVAMWISAFALLLDSTCHDEQMCHSFWCTLVYAFANLSLRCVISGPMLKGCFFFVVVVVVVTSLPFIVSSWHAFVSGQPRLRHAGYVIVA